jgi:membrane-bound lytic murein transglycosylase B
VNGVRVFGIGTQRNKRTFCYILGTAVAQWLRYCATNQKVAGSTADGVMEFFTDVNPSDRIMALGSTQPLTEMSTGSIFWG